MSNPDELLVALSAAVESERSNQMSLTVVVGGAVITGRLAPEAVWRERVAEVLKESDRLGPFSGVFTGGPRGERPGRRGDPTHLHFHLARSCRAASVSRRRAACTSRDQGRQRMDRG